MPADGLEAQDVVPGHFRRGDRFLGKARTLARPPNQPVSICHSPFPLARQRRCRRRELDADGDDVPIPCGFLEVSRRISKRLASKVDRPTAPQSPAFAAIFTCAGLFESRIIVVAELAARSCFQFLHLDPNSAYVTSAYSPSGSRPFRTSSACMPSALGRLSWE